MRTGRGVGQVEQITELERSWAFTVLITDRDGRQLVRYPDRKELISWRAGPADGPISTRVDAEPWVEVVEVDGRHMLRPGREWHPHERRVGEEVTRSRAAAAVFDRLWPLCEHFVWLDPPGRPSRLDPWPMARAELRVRLTSGDMVDAETRIAPQVWAAVSRLELVDVVGRQLLDEAARVLVGHLRPVRREVVAMPPHEWVRRAPR